MSEEKTTGERIAEKFENATHMPGELKCPSCEGSLKKHRDFIYDNDLIMRGSELTCSDESCESDDWEGKFTYDKDEKILWKKWLAPDGSRTVGENDD